MLVLVTGANSYLGGWVITLLKNRGHELVLMDSHDEYLPGQSINHILPAARECGAVIHLAWYAKAGMDRPDIHTGCLTRTASLLQRITRYQRFVFASSAAVYGAGHGDLNEANRASPTCAYGKGKLQAETLVREATANGSILRFGALMGLGAGRTKPDVCVNAFAIDGYRHRRIDVWNPQAKKPVIHVRDAAELICMAAEGGFSGVFNCAEGSYTASHLAQVAGAITGGDVREVADRSGYRSCDLNCAKLRGEMLRVCPAFVFKGVPETVREFQDYTPAPGDYTNPWPE